MKTRIIHILLIFCMCPSAYAQQAIRLNLHVGNTVKIKQESKQDITQKNNGIDQEMVKLFNIVYVFTVTEKNDSSYRITGKFNAIKFHSVSAFLSLGFNSELKHQNPTLMEQFYNNITKQSFSFTLLTNGRVANITGYEEYIADMVNSATIHDIEKQQIIQQFTKIVGDRALQSYLHDMFGFLPNDQQSLQLGWTDNVYLPVNPHIPVQLNYTLQSMNKHVVNVEASSSVNYTHADSVDISPFKLLSGTIYSDIQFNKQTGLLKHASSKLVFKAITVETETNKTTELHSITSTEFTLLP